MARFFMVTFLLTIIPCFLSQKHGGRSVKSAVSNVRHSNTGLNVSRSTSSDCLSIRSSDSLVVEKDRPTQRLHRADSQSESNISNLMKFNDEVSWRLVDVIYHTLKVVGRVVRSRVY